MYRDRIRESYENLSKSQKRIADFLMTSHREAAFMTASRLAGVLDVDVATITRFAQRLKYPGYPELLDEVRSAVQAEMSKGLRPVEGVSEAGRTFVNTLTLARENVERTLSDISIEAAEQAIATLAKAHTIYILGQHTAVLLAEKMAVRLQVIGINPVVVSGDTVQIALALRNVQADDVVVGFGYSGYSADVAAALRMAHERGAKTIGISGSDVSAVARSADITLICAANSPLHLPSEVAASAVVEGLTQALAIDRDALFHQNIDALGRTYEQLIEYRLHPVGSIEESIMKLY